MWLTPPFRTGCGLALALLVILSTGGSRAELEADLAVVPAASLDSAAQQGAPEAVDPDPVIKTKKIDEHAAWFGASGSFMHGFVATLSMIVVSELGDKTFFIAAIMAMRHSRLVVFVGAMASLGMMHVMSAFFGYATTIIPRVYTYYLSSLLFAVFGLKMLKEGCRMSASEAQEEFDEVQEDIRKKEDQKDDDDIECGFRRPNSVRQVGMSLYQTLVMWLCSRVFLQAMTMTFLAEWGDRSQLATIVLAAREDLSAVVTAGLLGHSICTGLAVIGGKFIAQRISIRTVTIIGGLVFLVFSVTAFFFTDPNEA